MKKLSFFCLLLIGLICSCNPEEDSYSPGRSITAEELKAASNVSVYQENGKNINYVHFSTTAPATVMWTNGNITSLLPTGDMQMLVTGKQTITVVAFNPDGNEVSADFNVNVDEISPKHPVSKYWQYLTGGSSKTWVWDNSISDKCWGNCGYSSVGSQGLLASGSEWWGVSSSGIAEQIASYKYGSADGGDASMTFTLKGSVLTKSSGGKGTFSFDEKTSNIGGYSDIGPTMGHLSTGGSGILFPVRINAGSTTSTFDISYIDDNQLILCYPNHPSSESGSASWKEGTYWRFKAKK